MSSAGIVTAAFVLGIGLMAGWHGHTTHVWRRDMKAERAKARAVRRARKGRWRAFVWLLAILIAGTLLANALHIPLTDVSPALDAGATGTGVLASVLSSGRRRHWPTEEIPWQVTSC